ncbi:MAG: ABC transporter permease subunit [Clostridia bacterium]|nr:ABC transporter permease subunit [Clostridia bacterium]
MKSFVAFFKKELLESVRSGKLLFITILFAAFGVMNPAVAKLTPYLMQLMADELAESGVAVSEITVNALTSWAQFFKNVPTALIAFILLYGGIFTKEYGSGTLVLVITKGLARYKIVLAKTLLLIILWTAGYWLCFAITYAYNAYFWDNGIASGLLPAAIYLWLFGVFVCALTVLFSVTVKNYGGVLLGVGGSVFALYLLGSLRALSKVLPTSLMNGAELLDGRVSAGEYIAAVIITIAAIIIFIAASIPLFDKKRL